MSWRRLRVLIEHLPPESATQAALRRSITPDQRDAIQAGAQPADWWPLEAQLAALLVDSVNYLTWVTANIQVDPPKRAAPPKPLPRPGVAGEPPKPVATPAQIAYLDDIRRRKAQAELDERSR